MVKVLFTDNPYPHSGGQDKFELGKVYDLPPASAERWKRRGIATDNPDEVRKAEGIPEPVKSDPEKAEGPENNDSKTGPANDPDPDTVEIPEDWKDLPWHALRALASKVTPAPVHNKEEAVLAVEAELERRAG